MNIVYTHLYAYTYIHIYTYVYKQWNLQIRTHGCRAVSLINRRRACAERVTVVVSCVCVCVCVCLSVCLSVCLYVCLSKHAILAVRTVRYITKDAIVLSVRFVLILKRRFSLNYLIRKLERFSLTSAGAAIFS